MNRGALLGVVAVAVGAVVVVVLSLGAAGPPPFDPGSTAPSGYAAVATILRDRGAGVDTRTATSVARQGFGRGDLIVVPAPELASFDELDAFTAAARQGATVVFGSPPPEREATIDVGSLDDLVVPVPSTELVDDDLLARTPASPVSPGFCDAGEYRDLGPIDGAFAAPFVAGSDSGAVRVCWADGADTLVSVADAGDGTVVTLAAPTLLTNARLWPAKEEGGVPLANAGLLLRPAELAAADGPVRVTFVRAEPSPEASIGGGAPSNPLRLLPVGVQAALVVAVVAFGFYAWGRSRRLGRVVREQAPVEIAGSELVEAVGDLLRRRGSPDRAAAVVRSEFRRRIGSAAGLGVAPSDEALCAWLERSSRVDPAHLRAALTSPVTTADELVGVARSLDAVEQEVTGVRHPA